MPWSTDDSPPGQVLTLGAILGDSSSRTGASTGSATSPPATASSAAAASSAASEPVEAGDLGMSFGFFKKAPPPPQPHAKAAARTGAAVHAAAPSASGAGAAGGAASGETPKAVKAKAKAKASARANAGEAGLPAGGGAGEGSPNADSAKKIIRGRPKRDVEQHAEVGRSDSGVMYGGGVLILFTWNSVWPGASGVRCSRSALHRMRHVSSNAEAL